MISNKLEGINSNLVPIFAVWSWQVLTNLHGTAPYDKIENSQGTNQSKDEFYKVYGKQIKG